MKSMRFKTLLLALIAIVIAVAGTQAFARSVREGNWDSSARRVRELPTLGASIAQAPADEAKVLFERACSGCHELSLTTDQRKTPEEWAEIVGDMIGMGAALDEDQAEKVLTYLVSNFGE